MYPLRSKKEVILILQSIVRGSSADQDLLERSTANIPKANGKRNLNAVFKLPTAEPDLVSTHL